MKNSSLRFFLFITFLFVVFCFISDILYSQNKVRVIKEGAVLRVQPDPNSMIIQTLPVGSIFTYEYLTNGWFKVVLPPDTQGNVISGYVHLLFMATEKQTIQSESERKPEISLNNVDLKTEPTAIGSIKFGFLVGFTMPIDTVYANAPYFGGVLTFDFHRNIALEVCAFFNSFNVEGTDTGLSKGKISRIPILGGIRAQFPLHRVNIIPYISVGGGYSTSSFVIDSSVTAPWKAVRVDIQESIDSKMAFYVGGGIDILLGKHFSIGADVKYLMHKVDGFWSVRDEVSGETLSGTLSGLDLSGVLGGITLKVIF